REFSGAVARSRRLAVVRGRRSAPDHLLQPGPSRLDGFVRGRIAGPRVPLPQRRGCVWPLGRGRGASANVTLPQQEMEPPQSSLERRADFVPLGSDPATANGVLAIVSAAAGREDDRANSDSTPTELHARIQ